MAQIEPRYYVQAASTQGDWWAFFKTADRVLAHSLAQAAERRWDGECRVISKAVIQREEGIARLRQADADIAALTSAQRREVADMAEQAGRDADKVLERVAEARRKMLEGEEEFRSAVLEAAQVYDYNSREIGQVAGLTQQRIHQIIQGAVSNAA